MARKLDYRWHLRQVMADRGMFATTDLIDPLAQRGIRLSSSQVYRLVVERPERLSLKILMALLDILDCSMDELIEPVAAAGDRRGGKAPPAAATPGVGALRPKRARITGVERLSGAAATGTRGTRRPDRCRGRPGRSSVEPALDRATVDRRRRAAWPAAGPSAAAWPRRCSTRRRCSIDGRSPAPRARSGTC